MSVEFYNVNDDLSVDLDDIRRKQQGAVGGVLLHYFGWPQPATVRQWISTRGDEGGYWIEDVTHGLFTSTPEGNLGLGGDASLASYRKLIPCADGSLLAFRKGAPPTDSRVRRSWRYEVHTAIRYARMATAGALVLGRRPKAPGLERLDDVLLEMRTRSPIDVADMSRLTRYIVERFDIAAASSRRRSNTQHLAACLGGLEGVTPLFDRLSPGVVPSVLPIRIASGRRDVVRDYLRRHSIEASLHWPRPREQEAGSHPVSDHLRNELLSLPIDERHDARDMERIADLIAAAIR